MSEDFLKSPVSFKGKDVYILGAGPNGLPHHSAAKGTVIAINRAIEAVQCEAYWLCIATAIIHEQYFHHMMHDHISDQMHYPILAKGRLTQAYPETPYHVELARPIGHDDYGIIPGAVRQGAGTVGAALHLAQQKQAKRCILVGVDMCGKGYFDDTENMDKRSIHPDGRWTQIPALQKVVDWCKGDGMDVVSLSPTKLEVEMI